MANKLTEEHKEKLRQAKLRNPVRYWAGRKRPELKKTGSVKTMFKKGERTSPATEFKKGQFSGNKHPKWKGGRLVNTQGYVLIYNPDHPFADHHGYIRKHRLIIEKKLKRYLKPEEKVHHMDKNKLNNSIENLLLFKNHSEHLKYEWRIGSYG